MTKAEKALRMAHGQVHTLPSRALSAVHGLSRLREPHGGKILALHRRDGGGGCSGCCRASAPARAFLQKKPGAFFLSNVRVPRLNLVSAALSPWREKTFLGAGRYDGLFTQFLYALTALGIARWGRKRVIYVRVFGARRVSLLRRGALADRGRKPARAVPERLALCRRGNALFRHVSRHGGQYPDPRLRAFARGAGARIYGGQKRGYDLLCCSPRQWRSMSCTGASARPHGSRCPAHAR